MNPPKVKGENDFQALLRIAYFICALSCSAFLTYHMDDVEFAAVHRPQLLKNAIWTLFLLGPLSILIMMVFKHLHQKWQAAASVLLGISVGSGTVMFCALSGMPLSIMHVIDSLR